MNTRQYNDMMVHIGAIYTKNDTKLSWSIGLGVDYKEN